MKLTRIRRSPRAPSRLVIEVDGARFASLPEERLADLGLREGMELGEGTRARLESAVDADKAHRRALRLLAARGRSGRELQVRLRRAGHGPAAVEEAVGRLEANGLIDDAAFADEFARSRFGRGYGSARVLRDLQARGVERRVAEQAVWRHEADGIPERERAEALARKRLRQLRGLTPAVQARRLAGYLARRGHGGQLARELIETLIR